MRDPVSSYVQVQGSVIVPFLSLHRAHVSICPVWLFKKDSVISSTDHHVLPFIALQKTHHSKSCSQNPQKTRRVREILDSANTDIWANDRGSIGDPKNSTLICCGTKLNHITGLHYKAITITCGVQLAGWCWYMIPTNHSVIIYCTQREWMEIQHTSTDSTN